MDVPYKHRTTKKKVKEDELMLFLANAEEWFQRNWRLVAYIAAGLAVIAIVFGLMSVSRSAANRDAGFELAEVRSFLNKGEYAQASEKLLALIKRRKGTSIAEEARLMLARVKFVEGNQAEAEHLFREFYKDHRKGLHGIAALNGIAVALESQGKLSDAYEYFRKVVQLEPEGIAAPQALCDAARVATAMNEPAKARENALEIIRGFPQSPLRSAADEVLSRTGR